MDGNRASYEQHADEVGVFVKLQTNITTALLKVITAFSDVRDRVYVAFESDLFKITFFFLALGCSFSIVAVTTLPLVDRYVELKRIEISSVAALNAATDIKMNKILDTCQGERHSGISITTHPDGTQTVITDGYCNANTDWLDTPLDNKALME